MIRPLTNQILLRILPKETHSQGGIEFPQRHVSPEEQQELNKHPEPPPPLTGEVLAIGPWPRLKNGLAKPPPFPAGSKVLIRSGSGQQLKWDVADNLRLVRADDVLAVIQETP